MENGLADARQRMFFVNIFADEPNPLDPAAQGPMISYVLCVVLYIIYIIFNYIHLYSIPVIGHIETHGCVGPSPAQGKPNAILVELNSSFLAVRKCRNEIKQNDVWGNAILKKSDLVIFGSCCTVSC